MALPKKESDTHKTSSVVAVNNPSTKLNKVLVIIFITFLIISSLLILYYNYSKEGVPSVSYARPKANLISQFTGYDLRLRKAYTSEEKLERSQVIDIASNNCLEIQETIEGELNPPYIRELEQGILAKIGVGTDNIEGLFFIRDPIPNTSTCWAIWVVDQNGIGVVGYRDKTRDIIIYNSQYPEELMKQIFTSQSLPQ